MAECTAPDVSLRARDPNNSLRLRAASHEWAAAAAPYALAAAKFLSWSCGSTAQAMLAAQGQPPVLAKPSSQAAFWAAPVRRPDAAAGDWPHFVSYAADWPLYPPEQAVFSALAAAVAHPASLAADMARAEQQWNAAVEAAVSPSSRSGRSQTAVKKSQGIPT